MLGVFNGYITPYELCRTCTFFASNYVLRSTFYAVS
jgi:hypothetical protein